VALENAIVRASQQLKIYDIICQINIETEIVDGQQFEYKKHIKDTKLKLESALLN